MSRLFAAALLLLALLLAACAGDLPPLEPRTRPALAADEAGLWQAADRAEQGLKAAPDVIRDPALNRYLHGVACRVAGPYCGDLRVFVTRAAGANAAMLPNGALILQSGLLLRLADEAQLAAVIGHELGHFAERHGFAQADRARRLGDIYAWTALFGLALGLPGVDAVLETDVTLDILAYGRDQERAADAFGLERMHAAGYAQAAALEVWDLILAEAGSSGDPEAKRLLSSHPGPEERQARLRAAVAALPTAAQERGRTAYRAAIRPFRSDFLADEVRLRQPTATLRLFRYMAERDGLDAALAFHWGEVYRLRGWQDDRDRALSTYARALAFADAPAETHRSIALVRRALGQPRGARFAFERYLAARPDAPDRAMIRAYLAEAL